MSTEQTTKRILVFLAFAFGIPWAAALFIYLTGMVTRDPLQAGGLANIFFIGTPWLANIAARLVTKEGWSNLWLRPKFKRGWPFYLAVWLLPLLATAVGAAAFYLLFPGSYDPNLGGLRALLEGNTAAATAGPWSMLLSITLSMMFVSAPINMVVSMGEEFGWRAYLLPKLVDLLGGERKAALLVGVIWGIWHWPLLIMTASITPGSTWQTPLVYVVFTCSLSVLLSWATLRSGSVWPAALGHGTINPIATLPALMLLGAPIALLGPDPAGLVGGIGYIVLALVLFFSRAFAPVEQAKEKRGESATNMA